MTRPEVGPPFSHSVETDLPDLSLALQVTQASELVVGGHLGIDTVELKEIDAVRRRAAEGSSQRT
jgi:hypothetical protein